MLGLQTSEPSLWSVFEAAAHRRNAEPALDFGAVVVSFRDLREASLRAAAFLRRCGVGAGDVVALQLAKRPLTYALMLGCLNVGAIYAPLDPNNPAARTAAMLARLRPKALICSGAGINPFGETIGFAPGLETTADLAGWPAAETADPAPSTSATQPVYVMFTSGSTGEPKGAVIPKAGILCLMRWAQSLIGRSEEQRFTAINPLHFDNSVFDFYCGLVSGATLVAIETSELPNPADWGRRISDGRATVLFAVPTLLMLLDTLGALEPLLLPHIETFVFGGEGYPIERLRALQRKFGRQAKLVNVYGPTETSCICTSMEITDAVLAETVNGLVSLGWLHAGFSRAVLDEEGHPVKLGETGELWIGGGNVGLGYYGNPEETGRRFRQDPGQADYRAICYRSGDLVRETSDGRLWFQGRRDNQIKIAGHRVELEEIDLAVEAFPGMIRAQTVLIDAQTAPQLVTAFVACAPIAVNDIAAALRDRLPAYMRPARLLQLDKLPTNANGKIDRLAVRRLAEEPEFSVNDHTYPVEYTETLVRDAWRTALGHDRFSRNDNFFDLGGTSLALTRVHAALQAMRPDAIAMTDLFEHPSVALIAAFLDGRGPAERRTTSEHSISARGERQQAVLAQLRARGKGPLS